MTPPPEDTSEAQTAALADMEILVRNLEDIACDLTRLGALDGELLDRLRTAAGRIALPDRSARRVFQNARRKYQKERVRAGDAAALATTSNRAMKKALRFPVAPPSLDISQRDRELLEQQAWTPAGEHAADASQTTRHLQEPARCYICKVEYTQLHHHYDSLCPACAEVNWAKRCQTADLHGRVALVTGARVKIGYEAGLMLLRAGASLIATTRFPCDAARRFAAEADFQEWGQRLSIFGLDLRHTPSVEAFAHQIGTQYQRLDFLIHNACQTVRRPPAYSAHLMEGELFEDLDGRARALLAGHEVLLEALADRSGDGDTDTRQAVALGGDNSPFRGLSNAAGMSQLDLLSEAGEAALFPAGMLDGEGQQLDLRGKNSWRMELSEVPTVELIEVQLVNSIAPFVLNARLKPLMERAPGEGKHVVNVSAMEGQFYRSMKTTRHPHTNMAKAALNMMTRTSAADYKQSGIHMNSVDTGWVTDEDPFAKSVEKETSQGFAPPLDSVDGAARVVDPIFTGMNTGVHCWGQFLKDYEPTRW